MRRLFDLVGRNDLRRELLRRRDVDQAPFREGGTADPEAMRLVATNNADWLKAVIDEVGWPGRRLVGEDGAHAAWLLAQHSDHDPEFQRRCLGLLEDAVARKDAAGDCYAYLLDRVRVNDGRPQLYGTQFRRTDVGVEALPIEDPEHVDERRAALGMMSLAEYAEGFKKVPWRPPE